MQTESAPITQLEHHIQRLRRIRATPGAMRVRTHSKSYILKRDAVLETVGYKLRLLCSRRATLNRQLARPFADIPAAEKPTPEEWSNMTEQECRDWFVSYHIFLRSARRKIQKQIDRIVAEHPELGPQGNAEIWTAKEQRWAENRKKKQAAKGKKDESWLK